MSLSIYNILAFNGSTTYSINDICSYTGTFNSFVLSTGYLYCTTAGLGGATPSSSSFDGYTTFNGEIKPKFLWTPSYSSQSNQNPKILNVVFGDGYESRMANGINNDLLKLDLQFDNREINETTALLHFLTQRNGTESFVLTPLPPYSTAKKFVCRQWREVQNFYDNYSISATVEEVPN